jgi:hypothetical protein
MQSQKFVGFDHVIADGRNGNIHGPADLIIRHAFQFHQLKYLFSLGRQQIDHLMQQFCIILLLKNLLHMPVVHTHAVHDVALQLFVMRSLPVKIIDEVRGDLEQE